jgi:nicotinamidase-related amidase
MKALLIIDMQVGCFAGEPPRFDQHGTIRRINALAQAIRTAGLVVFVQHTDTESYARESEAWQLLPSLHREARDAVVEKSACDSFLETKLGALLAERSVTELVIAGCATDFCVDTTVRAAAAHGFHVTVPSDGHTTRDRPHLSATHVIAHHNYLWADLILPRRQKVRVASTDTLLAEIQNA